MTEQLPISIHVCDDLKQQFAKISAVCNKLEAQFNFQTMTANWYGDEDNILLVQLCLEKPQSFFLSQQKIQQKSQQHLNIQTYSDDVFSYDETDETDETAETSQKLICHIAITETELALLTQQSKVLAALLRVKLQKVLNLIAGQLKLNPI